MSGQLPVAEHSVVGMTCEHCKNPVAGKAASLGGLANFCVTHDSLRQCSGHDWEQYLNHYSWTCTYCNITADYRDLTWGSRRTLSPCRSNPNGAYYHLVAPAAAPVAHADSPDELEITQPIKVYRGCLGCSRELSDTLDKYWGRDPFMAEFCIDCRKIRERNDAAVGVGT